MAASSFGVFKAAAVGEKTQYIYLERSFKLPKVWPGSRLFIESPVHLGWLIINGKVITTPGWMRRLDISGLVDRDGENVIRWVPGTVFTPDFERKYNQPVPEMSLSWCK